MKKITKHKFNLVKLKAWLFCSIILAVIMLISLNVSSKSIAYSNPSNLEGAIGKSKNQSDLRPEIIDPILVKRNQNDKVKIIIRMKNATKSREIGVSSAYVAQQKKAELMSSASELSKKVDKIENVHPLGNLVVADAKVSDLLSLTSDPNVEKIFADREVEAILIDSVTQINAATFWNAGYNGQGIKIAILDTGIDKSHPMLKDKVILEKVFTGEDNANDYRGHGTHVAGIAAGSNSNGGSYNGVAPNSLLINAKVLNNNGLGSTSGIVAGINWAVDPDDNPNTDDGADIISMSLGGKYNDPFDPMSYAIKDAIDAGVLVVVASGNCGECGACGSYSGVTTPGNSPWAFTVGAVDKSNVHACSSSGGIIENVGIKPDVSAPGVGILSSVPGGYSAYSGTSMATPHVAGAAALLLSRNPSLKPQEIRGILENTAKDLGSNGKDTYYGSGVIDLNSAFYPKAVIEAKEMISKIMIMGEETVENISIRNYGSQNLEIGITAPSWIHFNNLNGYNFSLKPLGNISFSYKISAAELGVGTHSGKIDIVTNDAKIPQKSITVKIDVYATTAPTFDEVLFPMETFSNEEVPISVSVTDNGEVRKVSVLLSSDNNSFAPVSAELIRYGEKLWMGIIKMPSVSSPLPAKIAVSAFDDQGFQSSFEKTIKISNLIIYLENNLTQGHPTEIASIFMNTNNYAEDIFAEFEVNDSIGFTVFKNLDESANVPTGFKVNFSTTWVPERFGTYLLTVRIKDASENLLTQTQQTFIVSLPQWGKILSYQLPKKIIKGDVLSYSVDFANTGNSNFDAVAALSLIDKHDNVKIVMPSEELSVPVGASTTLSASEQVNLTGKNYTALLSVYYGNRVESVQDEIAVITPDVISINSLQYPAEIEFKSPILPIKFSTHNAGGVEIYAEYSASIEQNDNLYYSEKFNGTLLRAGESYEISHIINVSEIPVGNYSIKVRADYEGLLKEIIGKLVVRDTTPPQIDDVKLKGTLSELEPLIIEVSAQDFSPISNISAKLTTPSGQHLFQAKSSSKRNSIAFFETEQIGKYMVNVSVCDEYYNCRSDEKAVEVKECSGDKVLVLNNRRDNEKIISSDFPTGCTYEFSTDNGNAPTINYLNKFKAVALTSGSNSNFIPKIYKDLLINYAKAKGNVLAEGADTAFYERDNEFMQNVTHSVLEEELIISIQNLSNSTPQSILLANVTEDEPHYISLRQGPILQYKMEKQPDSVMPINGGVGIYRWQDSGHAFVVYQDNNSNAKSVFMPFDVLGLEENSRNQILRNSFDWLLANQTGIDIGAEIKHDYLIEGPNKLIINISISRGESIAQSTSLEVLGLTESYTQDITTPSTTITGTFTFGGLGAGGNAALVDNTNIPAADPVGLNTGTNFKVDFGASDAKHVRRLTVSKDGTYGFSNPVTMKLGWSDDNIQFTQVGNSFLISAGTDATPQIYDFPASGAHRYWKVSYVSGIIGGNVWLREIEMMGISVATDNVTGINVPINLTVSLDNSNIISKLINTNKDNLIVPVDINLAAGIHAISAMAFSSDNEADYRNNKRTIAINVAPSLPDIVVTEINEEYIANEGKVVIKSTISNIGGSSVDANIFFFLDNVAVGNAAIGLNAGEQKIVSFAAKSGLGKHVISVKAKGADINDKNNELIKEAYFCGKEKILVVDGNNAELYVTSEPSSANEFLVILKSDGYCADYLSRQLNSAISLDYLTPYKLIIWSAGDYFGSNSKSEDENLLLQHGLNILIEGSDYALDHSNGTFLETIAGINFTNDIVFNNTIQNLKLYKHNITSGIFDKGLDLNISKAPYPDGVKTMSGDKIAEWPDGAAAITAMNRDDKKTVYYGFSVDAINRDETRKTLVLDTVQWLLGSSNKQINYTDSNKFFIKNSSGSNIASFGDGGNIMIKGKLEQNSKFKATDSFAFKIRNNGNDILIIENNGSMYIDRALLENQPIISSDIKRNDFRIKDSSGNLAINVNETGYVFLKGTLTQNGNP